VNLLAQTDMASLERNRLIEALAEQGRRRLDMAEILEGQ